MTALRCCCNQVTWLHRPIILYGCCVFYDYNNTYNAARSPWLPFCAWCGRIEFNFFGIHAYKKMQACKTPISIIIIQHSCGFCCFLTIPQILCSLLDSLFPLYFLIWIVTLYSICLLKWMQHYFLEQKTSMACDVTEWYVFLHPTPLSTPSSS